MDIYKTLGSFGIEKKYHDAFNAYENDEEFVNEYNASDDSVDEVIDKYSNLILEAMGKKVFTELTGAIVSDNPHEYFLKGFLKEMIEKGNTTIYDEELSELIDNLK